MQPKFIEVGSTVIAVDHIATVYFADEVVEVEMCNGRNHHFHGQNAADLRRYFRPGAPEPKKDT